MVAKTGGEDEGGEGDDLGSQGKGKESAAAIDDPGESIFKDE